MTAGQSSPPGSRRYSLRAGDDLGEVLQSTLTRTRGRQAATFTVAILTLLALAATMLWQARQYNVGNNWVMTSIQILLTNETVHSRVRATESDARAYRLTDRQDLLDGYTANKALLHGDLRDLGQLLQGDPERSRMATDIQDKVRQRLEHLDAMIAVQQQSGPEAAREAAANGAGPALMQSLENALESLSADQQQVLTQRKQALATRAAILGTLIVVGMLVAVSMLLMLRRSLVQEADYRQSMQRLADAQSEQLRRSLASLNRLSERREALNAYTGMLQSCENLEEALQSTRAVLRQLLPDATGCLYRMRDSRNLLEPVGALGDAGRSGTAFAPARCWALRRGQPYLLQTDSASPPCPHLADEATTGGDNLCLPLTAQGAMLGLLQIHRDVGATNLEPSWAEDARAIAEQLSLSIANLDLRETLRQQSLRDSLTGLYNRRYLEENLARELARCQRHGLPFSVVMLDIDHFKRFNDQHGHAAGDALLAAVGRLLRESIRVEDMACRYGGEEFILVLPDTTHADALQLADAIRQSIGSTTVRHMDKVYGPATASLGVASAPQGGFDAAHLQQAADNALYAAKRDGRNRVHSAHPGVPT